MPGPKSETAFKNHNYICIFHEPFQKLEFVLKMRMENMTNWWRKVGFCSSIIFNRSTHLYTVQVKGFISLERINEDDFRSFVDLDEHKIARLLSNSA